MQHAARPSTRRPRRTRGRDHPARFGNDEARKRGARRLDLRDPYRLAVGLTLTHRRQPPRGAWGAPLVDMRRCNIDPGEAGD